MKSVSVHIHRDSSLETLAGVAKAAEESIKRDLPGAYIFIHSLKSGIINGLYYCITGYA